MNPDTNLEKKEWCEPVLFDFGTVEELTQEPKPKWWGSGDDLLSIIS